MLGSQRERARTQRQQRQRWVGNGGRSALPAVALRQRRPPAFLFRGRTPRLEPRWRKASWARENEGLCASGRWQLCSASVHATEGTIVNLRTHNH